MRSDRSEPARGGHAGPAGLASTASREWQWFLAAAVIEAGWLVLLAWMAWAA
jgi:hypothetical protein